MRRLVPLATVAAVLAAECGWPEAGAEQAAADLAAGLGIAVTPGWRQVPCVAEISADRMVAEARRRRDEGLALEGALAAAAAPAAAVYAYTDLPSVPAVQHAPWAGRLP